MHPHDDDDDDDLDLGAVHIPAGEWKTLVYRREDLYQQVWTEPVREVAQRYGVSDVAFAKMCRKLKVPLPGRGYWTTKEDHRPPRPALRAVPKDTASEVRRQVWVPTSEEQRRQIQEAHERSRAERQRAKHLAAKEAHRIRDVRSWLEEWRLARDLRAFVAEGRQTVIDGGAKITKDGSLEEDFAWILEYADRVDPFRVLRQKVAEIARKKRDTEDTPPKS
jgi:hypothetical protein